MKIKVRTLKENNNEYDVQPTDTIQSLKVLIAQKQGCDVESQTLIFAGKILSNERTVEECGIKNEDFLVLMVKKTPGKPAATTNTSNPTPVVNTTAVPPAEKPPQPQTDASFTVEEKTASESLLTGNDLESSISNIINMGFDRELVLEAMKAAFNNPSRAIELLTSGAVSAGSNTTTTTNTPPPQPQVPVSTQQTPSRPASGSNVFDGLKQHPQFPQLCLLAQQGGQEALRQILQYFAEVSPPLLQLIEQNQQEFISLLSTPVTQAADLSPPSPAPGPTTPGVVRLHVTPEDERAIHNIVSMGFDRNRVVEAYFLFEKDENQTINFLLNNPESDN